MGGQQRIAPHLVQEELQCVGRRDRELAVDVARVDGISARAVVRDVDAALLDPVVEILEPLFVELEKLDDLVELGDVEATLLLPAVEQCVDLGVP